MIIQVEMGEGVVMESPHIIKSVGLGSCVAVMLYDSKIKIGGLAHVMLPNSNHINYNNSHISFPYQSADTAIETLLKEMKRMAPLTKNIVARMAGGARMFSHYEGLIAGIGVQNIMSIRELLRRERIPLISEDTGGDHGRSVEFHLDSGSVIVKAIGREDRDI
ncbi:MAG: chemotaxis protein CheD [Nitrospinae bacterium]|nr:chemotaxis protein CheD [Nitrospinota bacterium]